MGVSPLRSVAAVLGALALACAACGSETTAPPSEETPATTTALAPTTTAPQKREASVETLDSETAAPAQRFGRAGAVG